MRMNIFGQDYAMVSVSPHARADGTRKTNFLRRIPKWPASALQLTHNIAFAKYMIGQRGVTGSSHGMPTVAWNAHVKGFGGVSAEAKKNIVKRRSDRHAIADRNISNMESLLATIRA